MAERSGGWIYLSRELIADLLDLADAEVAEARVEVGEVARRAVQAVVLLLAAFALLFWVVALFGYTLIAVAALWLPAWGAGLVVAGFFLLLALGAALWAKAQLKRLENPIDILIRRLRAHLDWWRREVTLKRELPPGTPEPRAEGRTAP